MASDCKGMVWCRSGGTARDGKIAPSLGVVGEGGRRQGTARVLSFCEEVGFFSTS